MTVSVAPNQISYRIGEDDGTWSGHTWKEAKNTAAAWYVGTTGRVRVQVDQPNAANWSPALRLQIRPLTSGAWKSIPTTQASADGTVGSFWVFNSANEAQGSTITATACGSTPSTWQNGVPGYHDTLNPGAAQSAIRVEYTELEWNLSCLASTRTAATFYFRMTNNGTVFTTYSRLAQIKSKATVTLTSSFTALNTAQTLKELGFTALAGAGTVKELGFSTLLGAGTIKELGFAVLQAAGRIVSAAFSAFTALSAVATLKELAIPTLQSSGSIKELAASVIQIASTIKETGFAALQASGTLSERAITTVQASGTVKELGSTTLAIIATIPGEETEDGKRRWRRHRILRRPGNHHLLPFLRWRDR